MADCLAAVLAAHVPRTATEAADLERTRALALDVAFDRSTPLHVTGSAVVVHPPSRRVLLRWHDRQQAWLQVGGHGDAGESDPFAVAAREAQEETGLGDLVPWPETGRAPLHVVVVPVPAGKGEPAHEHADVRYVLATATPDAARPESTSAPMQWLTFPGAYELIGEDNLRETLHRVEALLGRDDR